MEPVVTWLEETRRTVLADVKRWRRYVTRRASQLQGALSLPELERRVLVSVDGTLRAVDERVRARLAKVSKKRAPKRTRTRKHAPRSRAPKPSSTQLVA